METNLSNDPAEFASPHGYVIATHRDKAQRGGGALTGY